jgi:hypothetical protein
MASFARYLSSMTQIMETKSTTKATIPTTLLKKIITRAKETNGIKYFIVPRPCIVPPKSSDLG